MFIDCKASTIDRIFLVKMIVKISGKFLNKTALKVKNEKLQIIKVYGISADHSWGFNVFERLFHTKKYLRISNIDRFCTL